MKRLVIFSTLVLISTALLRPALLPAQEAREIVDQADEPFQGTKIYSRSEMTVFRSGSPRPTMAIEAYTMDKEGKDHSLTVYRGPAKMKGTAYLMIENNLWVRFSSTGRTRKLSSSAKKNSAGGTDFSYHDLGESGRGISHRYNLRMERKTVAVEGEKCYEIAFLPKPDSDIPYQKLVAYITHRGYHYRKIDYVQDGATIKTLHFFDYRPADGRDYPFSYTMESHTRPSRTEVKVQAVEFESSKVEERFFTVPYLERIR